MWTDDPTRITSHRPWPLPDRPWIMAQRWNDLLFAHWSVDFEPLRKLVPSVLPLDIHDGHAWVSITPFRLSHLRPRGVPPIPGASDFPELNVRTYVTLDGKPGVYFFSLDAANPLAVAGARLSYNLPYFRASMSVSRLDDGTIHYASRRTHEGAPPAELLARYRPVGTPAPPAAPGSLDSFLAERYCLYTVDHRLHVWRAEIHHAPWPLQPADVHLERNTMAQAAGITLDPQPQHCAYAFRLDTVVWWPERAV